MIAAMTATAGAEAVADGAGERDEPSGAGASLRRLDEQPPSERQPAGEAVAALRAAARSLTQREPSEPAPRKRSKTGKGDGDRHTAQAIVEDYLELCADPSKDWLAWLAAAEGRRSGRRQQPITKNGRDYDDTTQHARMADADGIRGNPLQKMQIWLDALRQGGRVDGVFARSRAAGSGRYDALRQIQGRTTALTPRASNDAAAPFSRKGEATALSALYGAKIEATTRGPPARREARHVARCADQSPR
jgi:hypothetical protein